jgi:hypothetical protein
LKDIKAGFTFLAKGSSPVPGYPGSISGKQYDKRFLEVAG